MPRSTSGPGQPFRVFCLGGSTTAWPDSHGRDWASRVEELLTDDVPGRKVEVYNLGKEWYTSLHSLINYEVNLRQYKPDLILVMHAVNDLLENADFSQFSAGAFREDYGHFLGPVTRLVKHEPLLDNLSAKIAAAWYFKPRTVVSTEEFPELEPYKRNLSTLIDLAELDGVKIELMTEPFVLRPGLTKDKQVSLYLLNAAAVGQDKKWDLSTAAAGMEKYDAAVRDLAVAMQVGLIDLEKAVPKNFDYFSEEVHYRDRAFPLIAEYVAGELKRSGLLY